MNRIRDFEWMELAKLIPLGIAIVLVIHTVVTNWRHG